MKKDAYYFSHDANARNDQKIISLRMKFGMRGYGIYFGIIEILRESCEYMIKADYKTIAFDLREEESIIKQIIEDFDLFTINEDGNLQSNSLNKRMEVLEKTRVKRSLAGKKSAQAKRKQTFNKPSTNLQQTFNKTSALKESKVKESKVKNSIVATPTLQEVKDYCVERKNNIDYQRFFDFYVSKGWMVGKNKMKDWQAAVRTWERNNVDPPKQSIKVNSVEETNDFLKQMQDWEKESKVNV
jgi:hypothetical protein